MKLLKKFGGFIFLLYICSRFNYKDKLMKVLVFGENKKEKVFKTINVETNLISNARYDASNDDFVAYTVVSKTWAKYYKRYYKCWVYLNKYGWYNAHNILYDWEMNCIDIFNDTLSIDDFNEFLHINVDDNIIPIYHLGDGIFCELVEWLEMMVESLKNK